ncbi:CDP-glycerol glycerophosphotransferase family protein [Streptomyces sp. NPDC059070]|uniref:CDP-glycerol glycerophosphotransferase family protein n=1 Tax=Streptomyces sp. NPDC059070 TaxID=3346713 RepID=UPI0036C1FBCE
MPRPLFSVVVPVHRVQGFLREALESVLDQSYGDLELIVVDDRSPDGCAAIVAEFAEADARVLPVRLPVRRGVSAARNVGAVRAGGEYLLFLEGDGVLLPGALAALASRLRGARRVDVLRFGYERVDRLGRVVGGVRAWAGAGPGAGPGAGGERERPGTGCRCAHPYRPGGTIAHSCGGEGGASARGGGEGGSASARGGGTIAHSCGGGGGSVEVPVGWDRVYRRGFWLGRGLAFGWGEYGAVRPVLMAGRAVGAGREGELERVCVRVRERRPGAEPGRLHFQALDAYAPLLAADPALRPVAAAQLRAVRDDPRRIRPADRREFHRAADRLLGGALGPYPVHRARVLLDQQARAAREMKERAEGRVRARVLKGVRRADRYRALDDGLVVHGAYWNRGVACNPAAIHAKALEIAPQLRHLWVVDGRCADRVPAGTAYVVAGTRAYWRAMATAKYLVNNSAFPGGFTKREGQVYLQTHHGTPLKSMGLDLRGRAVSAGGGTDFAGLLARADQWDYSLAANPHAAEVWARAYPSAYESLELGQPRNDRYATATSEEIEGIRASLGIAPGRRALLYAPTHRGHRPGGEAGFVPPLDLEAFADALGEEYVLLVRAHYFHGTSAGPAARHPGIVDVTGHQGVEELCLASDALISDYSSLLFDYACLDRPIVVFAPDWDVYRATRGTYFDLLSGLPGETPGAVATSGGELAGLFLDGGWDTDAAGKLRAAFRARFCPYDDGRAAERVVRRVLLGERPAPPGEPPAPAVPRPAGEPRAFVTRMAGPR